MVAIPDACYAKGKSTTPALLLATAHIAHQGLRRDKLHDYSWIPPPKPNRTLRRAWTVFLVLILIGTAFMLNGCSTYQTVIADRSAQASDDSLNAVIWSLCNAMPVGAIKRRFQTEAEQAAYQAICPE